MRRTEKLLRAAFRAQKVALRRGSLNIDSNGVVWSRYSDKRAMRYFFLLNAAIRAAFADAP